MSSPSISLRNAPIFTGNLVGILVSLTLHAAIVLIMMYSWAPDREERQAIRPQYIEAKLLQMKPPAAEPRPAAAQPPPQPRDDSAARQQAEQQRRMEEQREQQARQE